MPLTSLQKDLAKILSKNRSIESHLAGGAALHFQPNSIRYSDDLDYFNDSENKVDEAFALDSKTLKDAGYSYEIEINRPGYIRCIVHKNKETTKIEWAQDSAWRFMPVQKDSELGYVLHPVDLAINKLLALVGRDEPRDFIDVLHTHESVLPLGAQCWAACGKDPGLSPGSILELLKRRGKYQPDDFERLHLTIEINLKVLKKKWLMALSEAESFLNQAPPDELGCLYYSDQLKKFVQPDFSKKQVPPVKTHFGKPGGILPNLNG